ncbi:MAG: hypothetical protein M1815_001463 [Lichina confinis]|nr:MAG: hypothetical protein M1815_001463 [Lichina confinis]
MTAPNGALNGQISCLSFPHEIKSPEDSIHTGESLEVLAAVQVEPDEPDNPDKPDRPDRLCKLDQPDKQNKPDQSNDDAESDQLCPHRVSYKTEYKDYSGDVTDTKEEDCPLVTEAPKKTAVEVITSVTTWIHRYSFMSKTDLSHSIRSIDSVRLVINSVAILKAIQDVVDYYPGLSLANNSLVVEEPFAVLTHHHEALKKYREQLNKTEGDQCVREEYGYEHLGLLLNFVESKLEPVQAEKERHSRPTPVVTYGMLWMLYRPGIDIYYDQYNDGSLQGFVVQESVQQPGSKKYAAVIWNMDFDGEVIGRRAHRIELEVFQGEKEVNSENNPMPLLQIPFARIAVGHAVHPTT